MTMDAHGSATALLLIDWQQGLRDASHFGQRNNPCSEVNAAALLKAARTRGLAIYHVRHASTTPGSPLGPQAPGYAFEPFAEPLDGEPIYIKQVNSAFIGTTLEPDLRAAGIGKLIVTGVTTDHCVSTSVRMAGNLGFDVTLAGDACHTFERTAPDGDWVSAEAMHRAHLASLNDEFCQVLGTGQVLASLGAVTG